MPDRLPTEAEVAELRKGLEYEKICIVSPQTALRLLDLIDEWSPIILEHSQTRCAHCRSGERHPWCDPWCGIRNARELWAQWVGKKAEEP